MIVLYSEFANGHEILSQMPLTLYGDVHNHLFGSVVFLAYLQLPLPITSHTISSFAPLVNILPLY